MRDYDFLRKNLRWDCEGDGLYRDGSDHYQIDSQRFERASRVIGSTAGLVIADFGSFPGFEFGLSGIAGIISVLENVRIGTKRRLRT